MKIFYKIIICILLFVTLIGCSNVKTEKTIANASWRVYSYEKMLELSDLIAEVKILGKSGEIDTPSPKTIFNAEVIDAYKIKGDPVEKIKLVQLGNSKTEFRDHELFKKGDRLVLFLTKSKAKELEGAYVIIGSVCGTFNLESVGGDEYVLSEKFPITDMKHLEDSDAGDKLKEKKGLDDRDATKLHAIKKEEFKNQIIDDIAKKVNYE